MKTSSKEFVYSNTKSSSERLRSNSYEISAAKRIRAGSISGRLRYFLPIRAFLLYFSIALFLTHAEANIDASLYQLYTLF
jgi:hypothetical protein